MDLDIAGLRVLVTAGAAGIGLEIARTFLREGARVHACDMDRDALEAIPFIRSEADDVVWGRGRPG